MADLWKWEDADEYGRYYKCTHCGYGIVVRYSEEWTPPECPNCGAEECEFVSGCEMFEEGGKNEQTD